MVRLAKVLHLSLDELVFSEEERGLSDDLHLQFEAIGQFDDHEKEVARIVLEGLIMKHEAKRWLRVG